MVEPAGPPPTTRTSQVSSVVEVSGTGAVGWDMRGRGLSATAKHSLHRGRPGGAAGGCGPLRAPTAVSTRPRAKRPGPPSLPGRAVLLQAGLRNAGARGHVV